MARSTIISSMKNECPYILEFLAHYITIGFEQTLIVSNDNSDDSIFLLSRLKSIGAVDYLEHSVPDNGVPQKIAFKLARAWLDSNAYGHYVYVADADEFLILHEDASITEYIGRFGTTPAISFNWKFFGSDGHRTRPRGLVMESYQRRAANKLREHRTLKSMFRFDDELEGFSAHFPHHKRLDEIYYQYADGTPYRADLTQVKPHQNWSEVHFDLACINHYGIKSYEEFVGKRLRGRGAMSAAKDLPRHTDAYFNKFDKRSVHDPVSRDHIERVRAKMDDLFVAADLGAHFDRSYLGL